MIGFMEINAKLTATCIHTESVEPHYSKLRLIRRVKFNYSATAGAIGLQDWVDPRIIFGQLFEHQAAEVDRQILDLNEIRWLNTRSSSCFLNWLRLSWLFLFFLDFCIFSRCFYLLGLFLGQCLLLGKLFHGFSTLIFLPLFLFDQLSFLPEKSLTALRALSIVPLLALFASLINDTLEA